MKIAAAYLTVLLCFSSACCAQPQAARAAKTPSVQPSSAATEDSMVFIHGGTFQMGIDSVDIPCFQKIFAIENAKLFQDEVPRHTVTVADFYLDQNLVTNKQFKNFVETNPSWNRNAPRRELTRFNFGKDPRQAETPGSDNARPDHPAVNVTWYAAIGYCHWAGKRLPAEAEWEFAARGGRAALFPWGDELPDESRANFNNNVGTTTPVGSYPANPYGLFDMAGNVWQFLSDRWEPYSADPGTAKKRNVRSGPPDFDPPVMQRDSPRLVIRGGSYAGAPVNLWLEYRDSHPANGTQPFVGFRCAKSVPAQPK